MKDNFGREIDYLRISVTDLCNLRCRYCMPQTGIKKNPHENILSFEEIEQIVKVFINLGIKKIRITGGEPLVRRGIISLIERLSKYNIEDFAITTNGLLLEKYALDLKRSGIRRVNVSLDTLNENKYRIITRNGDLKQVMAGIDAALSVGLIPLKINVVLIGGFNDDEITKFKYFLEKGVDVRFIELMPVGQASSWSMRRFISGKVVLEKIEGLKEDIVSDKRSAAKYYTLDGMSGKVGIIRAISCKFCDQCNRIRLTSDGNLKMCLHSDEEVNLRDPLRRGDDLSEIITKSIKDKPKSHKIEDGNFVKSSMYKIGG